MLLAAAIVAFQQISLYDGVDMLEVLGIPGLLRIALLTLVPHFFTGLAFLFIGLSGVFCISC